MRNSLLVALAAGCLTIPLAPAFAGPVQARIDTCRGSAATVVGTPGAPLTGTPGADVVITNGASSVSTLGGDDLVCVTGGTPYVDTATGVDVVDTISAGGAPVSVWLGAGADEFYGGDGPDTVGTHSDFLVEDEDADMILTGGGDDFAYSGKANLANNDTIDLGDGEDALSLHGIVEKTISGGSDSDTLVLDYSGKLTWSINNQTGISKRGNKKRQAWTAFEEFEVTPTSGQFSFIGSDGNESLSYSDPSGGPVGVTTVAMGGGNDRVLIAPQAPATSRYDGGTGRNKIEISSPGERIVVDLSTARILRGKGGGAIAASLVNFTDATVWAKHAVAKGDQQSNRLSVGGCTVKAYGLARGDLLKRLDSPAYDCSKRSKFLGGPGRDKLIGSEGRDKLYGGPGKDKANGGAGRDLCKTEKRKHCERR